MTPASSPPPHWPHFSHTLCGEMTDRERLGLPGHYLAARLDDDLTRSYSELQGATKFDLLNTLSEIESPLAKRIAAGNLLALVGDPRLCPETPEMLDIPGGEATLGLAADEVSLVLDKFTGLGLDRSWIEKECPPYRLVLPPYRFARYPVTNAEYRAFLVATGHPELPSSWHFRRFPRERANHPVYTVSPASADAYAQWLAKRTGRDFRLPTEAEWEWAAAGSERREFPWGDDFKPDLANTAETGLFTTSPVGAFREGASPFGVQDMAGNVEEYVADDYAPYPGGAFVSDHLTQIHGRYRIARGGSFARFRDLARTRRRHGHNPKSATYAMGFRLAASV